MYAAVYARPQLLMYANHEDVITLKRMMTSSNGNIFRVTGPLCGNSPVTGEFPSQRPVTRSFDTFLFAPWINVWVNNLEAGDLSRHRAHYDVIVMLSALLAFQYWESIGHWCIPLTKGQKSGALILLRYMREQTRPGLDTNGCPLGNSKFISLSDNLNICLWLSACQVEKIDQINNPWWTIY